MLLAESGVRLLCKAGNEVGSINMIGRCACRTIQSRNSLDSINRDTTNGLGAY